MSNQRAAKDVAKENPPKPRFALAVGVVGHRLHRLPSTEEGLDLVAGEIGEVLDLLLTQVAAKKVQYGEFFEGPPALTIVSALAEGADRIVARAAMQRGFILDAPLPFDQRAYEADFIHKAEDESDPGQVAQAKTRTENSLHEFHRFLDDNNKQTRSVLSLPGRRTPGMPADERDPEADRSYEVAGLTVLNQSDLIIGVWDGKQSNGRGGTIEMLNAATRLDLPVILILFDAEGRGKAQLRWRGLDDDPVPASALEDITGQPLEDQTMGKLIDRLVRPPDRPAERDALREYVRGHYSGRNLRAEYPLLMLFFGKRWPACTDVFPSSPKQLGAAYAGFAAPAQGGDVVQFATAYGWADAVAVRYAQMFRSAFVLNFAFAAFSVACAAASIVFHDFKPVLVPVELVFIGLVWFNTTTGLKRGWHRRWFEAREVAERLRSALPLWALGLRSATFFAGEEPTWTGWYARAIVRSQGMRRGRLSGQGLTDARCVMAKLLEGDARRQNPGLLEHQSDYNKSTAGRMTTMEQRLEKVGALLFGTTAFVAFVYLVAFVGTWLIEYSSAEIQSNCLQQLAAWVSEHLLRVREPGEQIITALTAGLPALATATYGIRIIGDFEGAAHRTGRTYSTLEHLIERIKMDEKDGKADLMVLRARANAAAKTMLGDVQSWRLGAESRGLAIPG